LDTSQTDEKLVAINKINVGLIRLVQEVIDGNIELSSYKNIIINFDHPEEEVFIEADRESLYQVINALVNNAISIYR